MKRKKMMLIGDSVRYNNTSLGMLNTQKTLERAMVETRSWLQRLGIALADIQLGYDRGLNMAVLDLRYEGQDYHFESRRQKNYRLNMWAIARAMEFKVRLHIMQVEPFATAMSPYLQLESGAHAARRESDEFVQACNTLKCNEHDGNYALRSAYLRLVKVYHPDGMERPETRAMMEGKLAEINRAWEVIKRVRGLE